MTSSAFASVALAPRDPILGLTEQFKADTRADKVNLGVGVYFDDASMIPLLECVREAEKRHVALHKAKSYQPIDGLPAYTDQVRKLVFGGNNADFSGDNIVTVQSVGGTGALKVGADFLKRNTTAGTVLISDPSWANHKAIFEKAGFTVKTYPYYDAERKGIDFDAMLSALRAASAGTVVVLHACCHNPTGYDLNDGQWTQVIDAVQAQGLIAFLDMAYQGFSRGITEDGAVISRFVDAGLKILVSSSFSKNLSLYGERVGALSLVCADADEAERVRSQVKICIRTNYSNPPTHGAAIAATVLSDPQLRAQWEGELQQMRERIQSTRQAFVQKLKDAGVQQDMSFVARQTGMFSYSGLSKEQMVALREQHGVYGTDSGRMCVAAINSSNIDKVCQAIASVL